MRFCLESLPRIVLTCVTVSTVLVGCRKDSVSDDTGGSNITETTPSDSGDTDTNVTETTDTGDIGTVDTGTPPSPDIVRFIAFGDGGTGSTDQYDNAQAVLALCQQKTDSEAGCDFALYLGDNFYDEGVDSVADEQFQSKFEQPYADLDFPFYIALGNHDYGGCLFGSCGAGYEFDKAQYYLDYAALSTKWVMPSEYYTFTNDHVDFFGLDTNALMWEPWFGTGADQAAWLPQALAASSADWKIAFGHHPFISNGQHGNAGAYEGLDWLDWASTDVVTGGFVEEVMSDSLCGEVDLYVCGHDHNRQWLEPTCGTEFIVSGAAAKTTDLQGRGNPTFFEDDSTPGFLWVEIRDNQLTGEFYSIDGTLQYSRTITK
jgi:tartrate-resistant acid phosphatase type 5